MNPKAVVRKLLKIVLWTVLGLAGLIIVVEIGDAIYLRWKYPEEFMTDDYYSYPELYEIPDTIIYGAAPVNVDSGSIIIPFQNLPIRDKSYLEIIDLFGPESVSLKGDWYPASSCLRKRRFRSQHRPAAPRNSRCAPLPYRCRRRGNQENRRLQIGRASCRERV